jgi:hypothetical protein
MRARGLISNPFSLTASHPDGIRRRSATRPPFRFAKRTITVHTLKARGTDAQSGRSVRSVRSQHVEDHTDRDRIGVARRFQTIRNGDSSLTRDAERKPPLETGPEFCVGAAIALHAPQRGNPPEQRERIRSRVCEAKSASEQRLPDRAGIEVTTRDG